MNVPDRSKYPGPGATALCIIGDGIGNIIEQSALVRLAIGMYEHVDVWTPRTSAASASIIQDLPGIRELITDPGAFRYVKQQKLPPYDAVFPTFLINRSYYGKVPFKAIFLSPKPKGGSRGEGFVTCDGIRRAGCRAEQPRPWCGYDPWPHPIPGDGDPRTLIGISAGGNPRPVWRHKRYHRYADVVTQLQEQLPNAYFVLVGTKADDPVDHINVTDLRGVGTLRQTCGLIRQCHYFIGNDCGLTHASAALGVPTAVVFGPTLVGKNKPPHHATAVKGKTMNCQPCQYQGGIGRLRNKQRCNNACLLKLNPATVVNAVLRDLHYAKLPTDGLWKNRNALLSPGT